MLRATPLSRGLRAFAPKPKWDRVTARRRDLEERRREDALRYVPPVEPTPLQAATLYRRLLKQGQRDLVCTDKDYFRHKVRYEFEVTARRASGRVRGLMFEKGNWMVSNKLGGLM
jgi:hypothetical protein